MPNNVGESIGSSLILWRMQFPVLEPGVVLETDDGLGPSVLPVPSATLVAEHGDTAPERLIIGAGGLAMLVGELRLS